MLELPTQYLPVQHNRIAVAVRREDLIHPFVSGNKYRKLKYNLLQARKENAGALLTFGGAFSNHIAAVAHAGKENGFKTVGIIRGEELVRKAAENPTLALAQSNSMQLEFVSRNEYADKEKPEFLENLKQKFGDFYLIPEGGTNTLAIKGCEEILLPGDSQFDYVCCAVGTGGTISGLINASMPHQKILGFPALKNDSLKEEIHKFATNENWELVCGYEFGGYGKINADLVNFINNFNKNNNILLDPVYTGKMAYGVLDLIANGYFGAGSKILIIHTGGLQGIEGMNKVLENKKLPKISVNV